MTIPENDDGLEIVLNLHPTPHSANWFHFTVASVSVASHVWNEHATGIISAQKDVALGCKSQKDNMDPRVVEVEDWYDLFDRVGLEYGRSFQGLSELRSDPIKNTVTARVILDTAKGMFTGPESEYAIHPSSLDICHQLALIACHGGQAGRMRNGFVPVFIDEVTIWPGQANGSWAQGFATGKVQGLRGAHADVQLVSQSGEPKVEIVNLQSVSHAKDKMERDHCDDPPNPYSRLIWKPDITTLSRNQGKKLFRPPVFQENFERVFTQMDDVARLMICCISESYGSYSAHNDTLRRFLAWANRMAKDGSAAFVEARETPFEDRVAAIDNICKSMGHAVDFEHTKRIFESLSDILSGAKTGVEVAAEGGLLKELYSSGLGISASYPQFERVLGLLGHRDPSMRILEIGGGTGGATRIAMRVLGAEGHHKQFLEYTFTDISSYFLNLAKEEFRWCKDVSYKTLDVDQCPLQQGFKPVYDLIIASECLHAAKDVRTALRNIRKLIQPDGKFVLLETTRTLLGHGIAQGTFPGYWPEDKDTPFLSTTQWDQHLRYEQFSGVDLELYDYPPPYTLVSTMLTTAITLNMNGHQNVSEEVIKIVHGDRTEALHETLASEIAHSGLKLKLVPLHSVDMPRGSRIIFTNSLEEEFLTNCNKRDFEKIKEVISNSSSMLWLTSGGMLQGHEPKAAVVSGLVRMLTSEDSSSKHGVLHLSRDGSDPGDRDLLRLILHYERSVSDGDFEREIAIGDNGIPHISRIYADDGLNIRYIQSHDSWTGKNIEKVRIHQQYQTRMVADFQTPGILSSLYFREDPSTFASPLQEDHIEIKTVAVGLNWKDLGASTGKLDITNFSFECTGIVTRCGSAVTGSFKPGDQIYALAWDRYGTYMRIPGCQARKLPITPNARSMIDFATVPVAFCSAMYALKTLGRLQKGERILIQSATGGLGLAAVQLARHFGTSIYATVGSAEKKRHLVEVYGISADSIFASRDLAEIPRMLSETNGCGFDVILSSSNGDFMHETLRCIARRGRFIDVGRLDVQGHKSMPLDVFKRNVSFSSFDLEILRDQEAEFCGQLLQEVHDMMKHGLLQPIAPIEVFDISELDRALLYLSRGVHIGKVVVTYLDDQSEVNTRVPTPYASFDPQAVRSGAPNSDTASMVDDLASCGASVQFFKCDVTAKNQVVEALRSSITKEPIKGILHAAAVLEDRLFTSLTHSQWRNGLGAKVIGAINLHEASLELRLNLDFFVMTSSIGAVMAFPTQAAYCAANSFQDAFARYRRSQGLPACSIAFGLITEIGDFGQRNVTRDMIFRNGLYRTVEMDFLRQLEAAFLPNPVPLAQFEGSLFRSNHQFDPLAEAQMTTAFDPGRLATEYAHSPQQPRWHSDRKFAHILQSMKDCIKSAAENGAQTKPVSSTLAITATVDEAIEAGRINEAVENVATELVDHIAALLLMPKESAETNKSVAYYGVDSLVAVELRNWIIGLFGSSIPLLKILDESVSIQDLSVIIVRERQKILENNATKAVK
ncbi:MAG: hypothetical protein M1820_010081 [Bogoriella megaspora]|nr:MAG: hypothetical protein M1820_010081 [Bogoriella megaspora]